MIMDGLLLFDTAVNITAATGTQASTNVIDLGVARDIGVGDDPAMKILVQVLTAYTGATSMSVALQGSTDNTTYTTMVTSGVVTVSAGALWNLAGVRLLEMDVPRPAPGQAIPRYLRLLYTTNGVWTTAGTLTATLVIDRQDWPAYPPGIGISN